VKWIDGSNRRLDLSPGTGHLTSQSTLAVSPDSNLLLDKYRYWELPEGKEVSWYAGFPLGHGTRISFSSSGKLVAESDEDGNLRLLEFATKKLARRLAGAGGFLVFAPDGRTLATRGEGHTVRLINLATGKDRCRLKGHQSWIHAASFSPDGKLLATSGNDSSILIWDLDVALAAENRRPAQLSTETLQKLWTDLEDADPARAYEAVWALSVAPAQSPPFLLDRARSLFVVADRIQIAQWIADLDAKHFPIRRNARMELERLGDLVEPDLRRTLAGAPSPEQRKQLTELLEQLEPPNAFIKRRRLLRAVEVLESIGTTEARGVLERIEKETPGTWLKLEVRAALKRLSSRTIVSR
jgi:hypothetical protein